MKGEELKTEKQREEVLYAPRNAWKARVWKEGASIIKDYGHAPLLPRLFGRMCLRWEEAALKRLSGIEGVPSFEERMSPHSIRISAVPGEPLDRLKRGDLSETFFERLVSLLRQIHERGVAHGDLHQRNILAHHETPYLIDFSTAYVRGRSPVCDARVFSSFVLLDLERITKVEMKFFGRGTPPRMFFLYRVAKGGKQMTKWLLKAIPLAIAFVVLIILADPNPFSLITGGLVVFVGEAVRTWASGHLIRNNEVTTSGPYAYLRDPLYLGRLFLLVGFCLMAWGYNWILLVLGLGVFFFNYMPRKYRKEMARLEDLFGQEYKNYASYTRGLIPRLKPYPHARQRPWRFDLFWHENREQYFVLGAAILTLLIVGRYFWS